MNSLDSVQMESMDLGAYEVLGFGAYEVLGPWCRWRWKSADYAEYEIHIALGASNNFYFIVEMFCRARKVQSQRLICFSQARSQPLGLQWQQLIANLVKLVAAFFILQLRSIFSIFSLYTKRNNFSKGSEDRMVIGIFCSDTVFVQLNQFSQILSRQCCLAQRVDFSQYLAGSGRLLKKTSGRGWFG